MTLFLSVSLLLIVILQQSAILPASAVEYYVTPVLPNPKCPPGQPCFELDQYALNSSQYFSNQDNVTLYFLDGDHNLTQELDFTDVRRLSWLGNLSEHSHVEIECGANITFDGVFEIVMTKLSVKSVTNGCVGVDLETDSLHLEEVLIRSIGIRVNSSGIISITKSIFYRSPLVVIGTYSSGLHETVIKDSMMIDSCEGSLFYANCDYPCPTQSNLVLVNVTTNHYSTMSCDGCPPDVWLDVTLDAQHRVNITNSSFNQSPCTGMYLLAEYNTNSSTYNGEIIIKGTSFSQNQDGGLVVTLGQDQLDMHSSNFPPKIHIEDCTFTNNKIKSASTDPTSASALSISSDPDDTGVEILISHSIFSENIDERNDPTSVLISSNNVTIKNCSFLSNIGTGLRMYRSYVSFSKDVYFANNSAYEGGGIALLNSYLHLTNNTKITFYNNTAQHVGGGILVKHNLLFSAPSYSYKPIDCFYRIDKESEHVTVNMINNSAKQGGDHIYGASLKTKCSVSDTWTDDYYLYSYKVWEKVFHFEGSSNLSLVSSDPTRACQCHKGVPKCTNLDLLVDGNLRFPGGKFSISAALVGGDFGTISGTIYTHFTSPNPSNFSVLQLQSSQTVNKLCNEIEFTVYSNTTSLSKWEILVLTPFLNSPPSKPPSMKDLQDAVSEYMKEGYIPSSLSQTPIYVKMLLLPCPLGFILKDSVCQCDPVLTRNSIRCAIVNRTGYIYRSGSVWINASYNDNGTRNGVILNKFCPHQYCKQELLSIELSSSNEQCAFDHSGILCGGCNEGYSLVLGSSRCLICESNGGIALLLFFLLAGFLLVLFIKLLDLTVTHGTINGLIFYANIIWVNQSILFPENKTLAVEILRVFLAWINLDFGIEVCFFNGLDAYWKTWMQFIFPIYIWTIAGVIIVLCRYSLVMTRLFGNNSLSVLATLILLSYSKLLRTVINIFEVAIIEFPDDRHPLAVWGLDGNVPYIVSKHGPLFCVGAAALLFMWLPYTLTLFLVPWLRAKSNWKCLRWINKFKPFFDVHYGPLKDRHHYWIGLLLLVRGFLFIIMLLATTTVVSPGVNLVVINITVAVLLVHPPPYKKWYVSLWENLFFLNIIVFCAIECIGGSKSAATITSITIALVQYAVVVFACAYVAMLRLNLCKRFCSKENEQGRHDNSEPPPASTSDSRGFERHSAGPDSGEDRYRLLMDTVMFDSDEEEAD